jgi:hypothetical protein
MERSHKIKLDTKNIKENTNSPVDYVQQLTLATCEHNGEIKPQAQQKFIKKFINDRDNNGIVLWHGLGSGKTLSGIYTSLGHLGNVIVLPPASLIGNFSQEYAKIKDMRIRNQDVYDKRAKPEHSKNTSLDEELFYTKRLLESNSEPKTKRQKTHAGMRKTKKHGGNKTKTDVKYPLKKIEDGIIEFYSHNGDLLTVKTADLRDNFHNNSLIIIDESQLLINRIKNAFEGLRPPYVQNTSSGAPPSSILLYNFFIRESRNRQLKIMALSGTPIINSSTELAILFNILASPDRDGELFDLPSFETEYSLENNNHLYVYEQDNSNSLSGSGRRDNYDDISSITRVKNANDFKQKIYGYLSYFGNIPTLLPSVRLIPGGKIGYNNEGNPLFTIIECPMNDIQTDKIIYLSILSTIDKNNRLLSNLLNSTTEFAFNAHGHFQSLVPGRPPRDRDQPQDPTGIPVRTYREITHNFVSNNMREYIKSIENGPKIPNKPPPLYRLMNVSSKMHAIISRIRDNPNSKHIIYCESTRINVELAHNLQIYLNYKEITGDMIDSIISNGKTVYLKHPMYMFLTGQKGEVKKEEIDDYIKYTNNEGHLKNNNDGALKERMIQFFNDQNPGNVQNPGPRFNIIILNSAAAEGITLKKVHYVHFLDIPPNMSRLYQVIGRAIRNCTHSLLEKDQRYVVPIMYLSRGPRSLQENTIIDRIGDFINNINNINNNTNNINFTDITVEGQPCTINSSATIITLPDITTVNRVNRGVNRDNKTIFVADDIIPKIQKILSSDITKYEKIVRENDDNLPYLRLLKEAAIDCDMISDDSLQCFSTGVNPTSEQNEIYNSNYRRNREMKDMTAAEKYQREQEQFQQEIDTGYRIKRIEGKNCPTRNGQKYKVDEKNKQWCIRK